MRRLAAVLAASMASVGCSAEGTAPSSAPSTSVAVAADPSPPTTAPTTTWSLPRPAPAASVPGCEPPWLPVHQRETYPEPEAAPLPATDEAVVRWAPPVAQTHDRVSVQVADGVVVVEQAGARLLAEPIGDLDGDRVAEVWVTRLVDDVARPGPELAAWVVRSGTPAVDGAVAPDEVGEAVPPGRPWVVADRDGDDVADVLSVRGQDTGTAGPTVLLGGASLGDGTPEALEVVDGAAFALLDLGEALPSIVTHETSATETVVLRVRRATDVVVLDSGRPLSPRGPGIGWLGLAASRDGRWIVYGQGERYGAEEVWWGLDEPCAQLTVDAARP